HSPLLKDSCKAERQTWEIGAQRQEMKPPSFVTTYRSRIAVWYRSRSGSGSRMDMRISWIDEIRQSAELFPLWVFYFQAGWSVHRPSLANAAFTGPRSTTWSTLGFSLSLRRPISTILLIVTSTISAGIPSFTGQTYAAASAS